jgi:hypothetical protein
MPEFDPCDDDNDIIALRTTAGNSRNKGRREMWNSEDRIDDLFDAIEALFAIAATIRRSFKDVSYANFFPDLTGPGSRFVLRKLIGWIEARLVRLGQDLSSRRFDLRRPLVHGRLAWGESSECPGRQNAIHRNRQLLPAHFPYTLGQRKRQHSGAFGNVAKMEFRIWEQRDAARGPAPGKIQRHGIGKGRLARCKPSDQRGSNEPR